MQKQVHNILTNDDIDFDANTGLGSMLDRDNIIMNNFNKNLLNNTKNSSGKNNKENPYSDEQTGLRELKKKVEILNNTVNIGHIEKGYGSNRNTILAGNGPFKKYPNYQQDLSDIASVKTYSHSKGRNHAKKKDKRKLQIMDAFI
jgi:hypothetical protein